MRYINNTRLSDQFTVNKKDVNTLGKLTTCKILSEITAQSDQAILLAFGDLGYYRSLASSYSIDFLHQARRGETVAIETSVNFTPGKAVQLVIEMYTTGRKTRPVATGRFTFTNVAAA